MDYWYYRDLVLGQNLGPNTHDINEQLGIIINTLNLLSWKGLKNRGKWKEDINKAIDKISKKTGIIPDSELILIRKSK